MVKAKRFVFDKQFHGFPKESDLKLVEEELPPIKDGEFLTEAVYLSVDPYMRAFSKGGPLETTFVGSQVAKIIESKNAEYPVGKYVVGQFGWRTHTISDGKPMANGFPGSWIVPDPEGIPLSLFLSVLGMPGNTAYFGFLEICKPKRGETIIVTGAAGAVGSLVGQIAKIKGCTAIGVAGSEEKGRMLLGELGFDRFVNYKDPDFDKKLAIAAPKGIDCYFDNVGGEITSKILNHMNQYGRIAVCGVVSAYNDQDIVKVTPFLSTLLFKQLRMEGFVVHRWLDRWYEGIRQNRKWIKEGKLKYKESVTNGFENMYKALMEMIQGGNVGKSVVKV